MPRRIRARRTIDADADGQTHIALTSLPVIWQRKGVKSSSKARVDG